MDRDRFRGCLIGQCLGDALGFPVEGRPPRICAPYVEETMRGPMRPTHRRAGLPFGQYTDDSQLARELMRSYAARGRFDPEDFARRLTELFVAERVVGRGLATHRAAMRLANGVHWTESGEPTPSAGNGSAMRAGPIGLLYASDPGGLARAAHDQGRITHTDPRCSAGAAAIATAVALACEARPVDPARWCGQIADAARPFDAAFADELRALPTWLELGPARAVERVPRRLGAVASEYRWEGISPFVVSSVLWSLYAFLRSPDDYWETMCTAIAVGGDVDTTAAMAGAISGARVGLEGLPRSLARTVTDQGEWEFDALVTLADECHAIASRAETIG